MRTVARRCLVTWASVVLAPQGAGQGGTLGGPGPLGQTENGEGAGGVTPGDDGR
jgi:hypothetical protein